MKTPIPDFRLVVDGVDVTARLKNNVGGTSRARLLAFTLTEKRDGEADELSLQIDDSDGKAPFPKDGAKIQLQLGWLQGDGVTTGLIDKGAFIVDSAESSGPPDAIAIRARSADFTSELTLRKEKSWHQTTLGAVVKEVAGAHGLTPRCADALASIEVDAVHQSRESDMALLRRLGREHDAVATIKHGALILSPKASGSTASGKMIPAITIVRGAGDRFSFTREKRDDVTGIEASWHDHGAAKKKIVKVGADGHRRRLARVYATEADATSAANAEQSRLGRAKVSFRFDLAFGRPDLYPERRVAVSGFKEEITSIDWLITEARHDYAAGAGLTTSLQLEAA